MLSKLRVRLLEFLGNQVIELVDVGARGGVQPHWQWLNQKLHITMLEPDPSAAAKLRSDNTNDGLKPIIIETAVWNNCETYKLNITRSGGCSSLLEPNRELLSNFPNSERFSVVEKVKIKTNTLDSVLDPKTKYDFLKIDAQGGSLMVLEGSERTLEKLLGLEVEAEFLEMYKGGSLFGEIHDFLSKNKFQLVDFRPTYWQRISGQNIPGCKGQMISSDMLYLVSPENFADRMENLSSNEIHETLGRLIICCSVYGLEDWMVSYMSICFERNLIKKSDLLNQIDQKCKAGGIFSWLPKIPGQMGICMLLRDIAFHIDNNGKNWVYQDNTLGNMARTRWTKWMRNK